MREWCYVGMTGFFLCGPGGGELHFKCLCNNTTVIDLKHSLFQNTMYNIHLLVTCMFFFSQILQYKCTCTYDFGHFHPTSRTK